MLRSKLCKKLRHHYDEVQRAGKYGAVTAKIQTLYFLVNSALIFINGALNFVNGALIFVNGALIFTNGALSFVIIYGGFLYINAATILVNCSFSLKIWCVVFILTVPQFLKWHLVFCKWCLFYLCLYQLTYARIRLCSVSVQGPSPVPEVSKR